MNLTPENREILKKNILLNKLKNVIIVDKALFSHSDITVNLQSNGTMSHIMPTQKAEYKTNFRRYSVKTITFDDLITDLDISPSALKMDIEVAEKFVLQSAVQTLNSIKLLEAEIHDLECEQELMRYHEFNFEISNAENINNVYKFAFRHPFKIFRLEYNKHFETIKRLMANKEITDIQYPKIIYGSKIIRIKN